MNRYNKMMASHFGGCPVLAQARDHSRQRNVTIHVIPGDFDVIGITDGVDAWMAPSSVEACFSVPVRRLLQDYRDGKPLTEFQKPVATRQRKALVAADDEPAPVPTRRPTNHQRSRRAINIEI